jgi:hypothetical protein
MKPLAVIAILFVATITGCSDVRVTTDTYLGVAAFPAAGPDISMHVEVGADDEPILLPQEIQRTIERELELLGYRCVGSAEEADFVLSCEFGISEQRTVTRYVPTGPTYGGYGFGAYRFACGPWNHGLYGYGRSYWIETYDEYDHRLLLTLVNRPAYDEADDDRRDRAIAWQAATLATVTDENPRVVVRYLLAAAFSYFGLDTGEPVSLTLNADSEELARFEPEIY